MDLLTKLERREALLSVIGLGYVGLPLATAFAEAGLRVVGVDNDQAKVASLKAGRSYVADVPDELLRRLAGAGRFQATSSYEVLAQADVVIICVPTPLSKTKDPDLGYIVAATGEVAKRLHPQMLVVLESTTYPGTTEEVVLPLLSKGHPLRDGRPEPRGEWRVGEDFFLAFSPERIDPGRKDQTLSNTPKVISGVTPRCLAVAQAVYGCAIQRLVPVSSPKAAEMVKLLENTFRAVNIGLVNEMAMMCDRLGIDVWEVIDAAATKPFGFMPFYPGPGLGGHCIPIDPEYLAWKMKTLDYNTRFIQLASEINHGMPHYVLQKVADALNDQQKSLKGSRVLVLGVAYKRDTADSRESPAIDLIKLLADKGTQVTYHDPYVPQLLVEAERFTSVPLTETAVTGADCVVIVTDHSAFDWKWLLDHARLVVDTRNATKASRRGQARVVTL